MPELGEIKSGHKIGYKSNAKRIWHACEICGKERWVSFVKGKPEVKLCDKCNKKMIPKIRRNYNGINNPHWRGGIHYNDGYVFLRKPEHPRADKYGYVKLAILVLEEKLGRPLLPNMDSHHINGIKDDDRPENLEELSHSEHLKVHGTNIKQFFYVTKLATKYLKHGFKRSEAMRMAWSDINLEDLP